MTTLLRLDSAGKILEVVTPAANTENLYGPQYTIVEEDYPPGSTHYIDGEYQTLPDIEELRQELRQKKFIDLNIAMGNTGTRTFSIIGHTFTFLNKELELPGDLEGGCILRDDSGTLVTLNNNQVNQLRALSVIRAVALHNNYVNLKLLIANATTIDELIVIDPYSI